MLLYSATTKEFRQDVLDNSIGNIMSENFYAFFGREASKGQKGAFQNSSQYVNNIITLSDLDDNHICLEYEVPYNTSWVDCLLFGEGINYKPTVALIELKQWTTVQELDDEENFVETFTGGGHRRVAHPSQQVAGYDQHLRNFVSIFETDSKFGLYSLAYCHNYEKNDGYGLFAPQYNEILQKYPIFTKNDTGKLAKILSEKLGKGQGLEVFNRFMQSPIQPSKKLLENAKRIIDNEPVFSLLNEQLVARNLILSKIRKAEKYNEKNVVIVKGGPGTGKSVIAVNVMATLGMKKGRKKIAWACKSKPFREAMQKSIGKPASDLFVTLEQFTPSKTLQNDYDLLVIDEAHRIGQKSGSQYTPKQHRTDMPQVEQLIRAAKTTVFFIDDQQTVRAKEIGNTDLIREYAKKNNASIDEVELISQFRCAGSDNYLDYVESILGHSNKKIIYDPSKDDKFDFRIFDSVQEMYDLLKEKENKKPNAARMVAGYCWKWNNPNLDGTLPLDVEIGGFKMPWEARDGFKLAPGIPKWYQWAFKSEGINQVGCIYTVQGFEFDYIGVIIGKDLRYDKRLERLVGDPKENKDPMLRQNRENFEAYVKNIYRVLLTRGMKGCFVYFTDEDTREYFKRALGKNKK